MCTAAILFGSASPALASTPAAPDIVQQVNADTFSPYAIFYKKTKSVKTSSGIKVTVKYTYNDSYANITQIDSISLSNIPANLTHVTYSKYIRNGGKHIEVVISFYNATSGRWGTNTAYIYA